MHLVSRRCNSTNLASLHSSAVCFAEYRFAEDRSTHNRLAEGLNIAKGCHFDTAIMASGQNSQKQRKSVLYKLELFRFHHSKIWRNTTKTARAEIAKLHDRELEATH